MKLGKLPARLGAVSFKLSTYVTLPKPPKTYGHFNLVKEWDMLGNDQYGDCVWAGAGHETILWNDEAKKSVTITTDDALSDYSAVTGFKPDDPNSDQGTDMSTAASYRRKTGVKSENGRHKVGAYLAIKLNDVNELKSAISLFSAVGVGIQFPSSAMTQFNKAKPWTVVSKSPIEGGHYIPAVGYDSRYVYIVTWGQIQKMSWGFYEKYADEAIAYLSTEMLTGGVSLEGINLSQLTTDLGAL